VSDGTVDGEREVFQRSAGKSTCRASNELRVPHSTVVNILHKLLKSYVYKVQMLRSLQPDGGP
jgi:hypothetical protein